MLFNTVKRSEHMYWIWLALRLNNQNTVFQRLLDLFDGSVYDIYRAGEEELRRAAHLTPSQLKSLLDKNIGDAMSTVGFCRENGIEILCYNDLRYPAMLRCIKNPPIVLYCVGKLPDMNNKVCVSVVGTRKMTEYGMRSCYKIAYELASAGVVVVSGMALGIDSIAHAGAIGGRGETVAVLGCGVDVIYPKQHTKLRRYICEHGAVISAYHPGTPAYKHNFPERNAIISALCEGTLVVEAPVRSGALITAEYASEQSRTVYALPGSIEEPMSEGPNELIKSGAVAITCARDILGYYFEKNSPLVNPVGLRQGELSSDFDKDILDILGISSSCHAKGPAGTPTAMLKKLNEQLNNNAKINKDYYAVPNIKKIDVSELVPKPDPNEIGASETEKKREAADESEILASLGDDGRAVYSAMPKGKPVSVDAIVKNGCGISIPNIMATLTVLEIRGLVTSLPGSMYVKK